MKTFARKAAVVVAVAGIAAGGAAGVAAAAGQQVTGTGWARTEGSAYAIALSGARNQCPHRDNVSLVSRSTWASGGDASNGYWAVVTLRCD
ncbi:hypothetical protein [Streptomyces sp. AS02]|uniref:hypothetical protein n=1 Tax=Streptomyces sp. AS02 TaxID=2938946 RepID=UPI00201FCD95|nr:hypothetical protein [Streptomyces sp. AS02]MCL8014916.1 hypothetical protein [Streptomyces sp. AS02]